MDVNIYILWGRSEEVRQSGQPEVRRASFWRVRLRKVAIETVWSLLNCRATAALAQSESVRLSVCMLFLFMPLRTVLRGWLTSVYSSLPLDASYTSLPPLQWKPVWGLLAGMKQGLFLALRRFLYVLPWFSSSDGWRGEQEKSKNGTEDWQRHFCTQKIQTS